MKVENKQMLDYLSDSNLLLDEIDRELEKVPLEQLPRSIMSGDRNGKTSYREVEDGRPKHRVLEVMLDSVALQLRNACCVRAGYCDFKRNHREAIDVVKAVVDGLVSAAFVFPIPVGTVAVYCVQSLFLDRLCECSGAGPPDALSN